MNTPHRGLRYDFEVRSPGGILLDKFHAHNLVPIEGLNFLLGIAFKSVTQVPTWYLSIYEADYTPDEDVTAATLPGLATEITAYTPSTRPEFVEGAVAAGSVSNAASLAEMTFTAQKTVRCVAMSSASAKGSTAGTLLSVVRLPSPKTYDVGSILRVFAGPSAISAS
ncbi:hypothetical protein C7T35_01425 [Variovorax sp. WS11]|uniref:phage tail fiber protein n=1 Tax=Variovorax sp. WS11 TaxID=1105204 RepID=UPI000D0E08E9|nr:hypothetical protein [Variovorax sp. WS11]NDZ11487.1 hypothetical protein [Variovorax sp. WS11]PSL86655.1 hypothetical protein C7T35_01425 [Variovorax sp. WS11]